ncbi:MAG: 2-phosphosulfolactate phosphatase [Proteobacteria bacterium]|nr:2-phosphosulfolactate phosphatase [Pseudomonadota bacterium]
MSHPGARERMRSSSPARIHVVLKKEDITDEAVAGKIAIVLDVMFATIVAALAAGAREVVPALDPEDARVIAAACPPGSFVLAGERNLDPIPGFAAPYPLAISRQEIVNKTLVYSTTNGTVALRASVSAARVYAAALVNAPATARHVIGTHADLDWVVVCAGSRRNASMEDLYAAGFLVDAFAQSRPGSTMLSDSALAARTIYRAWEPLACLRESRLGRIVFDLGQADELEYAARIGTAELVCAMESGALRRV